MTRRCDLLASMSLLTRMWGRLRDDAGMSTAEYAVGTIAAVAFAVVLYKVVSSGEVQAELADIIRSALHAA